MLVFISSVETVLLFVCVLVFKEKPQNETENETEAFIENAE